MTCNPDAELERELRSFPDALRDLLYAELAAGNSVTEIGGGFPAPPCGAWLKLARPVCTRPRASADGVLFRARNWPSHSVEWSDSQGHFFLLEPPLPPAPDPEMDKIRDAFLCGAGLPLVTPPPPPPVAPGAYRVDIDYRGELLTYREADRVADVTCTWGPHPIIRRSNLTGWRHPGGGGTMPLSDADRRMVIDRICGHLLHIGMKDIEFED